MTDCKVRWPPSIHRNKAGPADYGLLMCKFRWRVKEVKQQTRIDYSALITHTPEDHSGPNQNDHSGTNTKPQPSAVVESNHNRAFTAHLNDLNLTGNLTETERAVTATFLPSTSTEALYERWTKAVRKDVKETLPAKATARLRARGVSERTKKLYRA